MIALDRKTEKVAISRKTKLMLKPKERGTIWCASATGSILGHIFSSRPFHEVHMPDMTLMVLYSPSGESGLVGQGAVIKTERFPVHTPKCAWPGLGNQSCYKSPRDLQVMMPNM